MTDIDIVAAVRDEATRIQLELNGETTWYLFGSAVRSPDAASDVDLIVICEDDQTAIDVREKLSALVSTFPIHLFIATKEEEAELRFLAGQSAQPLLEAA